MSMDLALPPAAESFRRAFRAWLEETLPAVASAGDPATTGQDARMALRRRWGRALFDGGWAAPQWPEEHGGLGLGIEEAVVLAEELARADAPHPFNSNAMNILGPTLLRFGTGWQQRRYLRPMLAHEETWCQAFSEPGAGSDLAGQRTRAERDGAGFRLSGHKIWSSRAQYADRAYVLVRSEPGSTRRDGLSLVLLALGQPGVEVRPIETMAGTSDFCELFLDGAWVESTDVVGEPGDGWRIAMYALGRERGPRQVERALSMHADLTDLVAAVRDRRPRLDDGERGRIVDAYVRDRVVASVCRRILAVLSAEDDLGVLPSVLKLSWSRSHQEVLRLRGDLDPAAVIRGREADGVAQETFLFSRGWTLQSGTTEVQRNVVAKALGLPSSR
jgi:alkylation response protein AidB-like acyl-CoA dehydrogenase